MKRFADITLLGLASAINRETQHLDEHDGPRPAMEG